jgi:diamine N-acetyltransferase
MMLLKGDLVLLRAVEPTDADLLYCWENDTSLWRFGNPVSPYSHYHLEKFIETAGDIFTMGQMRLMIDLVDGSATVGCVDLFDYDPRSRRAEVAILVDVAHQGNHYGKEALNLLSDYVFNHLHFHQLYAYVGEDNEVSRNLFSCAGFSEVALLKDWFCNGSWENCFLYQKIE